MNHLQEMYEREYSAEQVVSMRAAISRASSPQRLRALKIFDERLPSLESAVSFFKPLLLLDSIPARDLGSSSTASEIYALSIKLKGMLLRTSIENTSLAREMDEALMEIFERGEPDQCTWMLFKALDRIAESTKPPPAPEGQKKEKHPMQTQFLMEVASFWRDILQLPIGVDRTKDADGGTKAIAPAIAFVEAAAAPIAAPSRRAITRALTSVRAGAQHFFRHIR